jgi:hypothetical protein
MSFTAQEPASLVNLTPGAVVNGFVTHGAVTGAPGVISINHGAIGGTGGPFQVGTTMTSTSGGTGTIAQVVDATTLILTGVVGAFNGGGLLTQTTGANAGSTATQSGASAPLPFAPGAGIASSSGGTATIGAVPSATRLDLTGVTGTFNAGDTLTQTTGLNAGATAVQSATGLTMLSFGPFSVKGFLNGRLRGNAHSDAPGAFTVSWGTSPSSMGLSWVVPQDASQPDNQYPFDIIILQPFVSVSFVNGGAAALFFRANLQALPI